jgi:two-component system, OmpR family, sensor histidine kinase MtrB
MGLRGKLGLIFLAVSTLAIIGLGTAVYTQAQAARLDRARKTADERVHAAAALYEDVGGNPQLDAKLDDPELPPEPKSAIAGGDRVTLKRGNRLWAAQRVDGRTISVNFDYANSDASMDALERALLLGGIGTVLGVGLVSVVAAGSLSRRIVAVSGTAKRIAAGELDASAVRAVGEGRDEVASLAKALDTMAASLRDRLDAERRFTADVAHDLRTPVTGLLTAAELLPPGRPSELVRDRATVLRTLVEDLLEVARFDSGVERADLEQVELGALVGSAIGRLRTQQSISPDDLWLDTGAGARVLTDPRRVERILANLVLNGLRHGRPPVQVTVSGRAITVTDHGSGYPEALINEGPRRFRSGMAERGLGHGLGLTIAAAHARVLGAGLMFSAAPHGGASARLELPAVPPTDG